MIRCLFFVQNLRCGKYVVAISITFVYTQKYKRQRSFFKLKFGTGKEKRMRKIHKKLSYLLLTALLLCLMVGTSAAASLNYDRTCTFYLEGTGKYA